MTARPASTARRGLIAKLHIARKALALTEDSYRDVLRRITGLDSAKGMTEPQLEAALAEFRRLGFQAKPARRVPRSISKHAQIRMIHGVWRDLAPHVADPTEAGLRAFVRRQTRTAEHPDGISAAEFLDGEQANKVLEGLKAWLARERRRARTTPKETA